MLNSKTQASPLALVGLQSKKPIGERALGLVAAYMPARTESCSFDEARSPMGLRVRFLELHRVTNPVMEGLYQHVSRYVNTYQHGWGLAI